MLDSHLGVCYYNGLGVRPDERKALDLFMRAAAAGHDGATQVLKELGSQ